ncbi:MAG: sigma 54-interacting transcriptional regulator [Saprospiraceae bacterium]
MSALLKKKILILDDKPEFYDRFRNQFDSIFQFNVLRYYAGKDLEGKEQYDVLLLDLDFGFIGKGKDGYQYGLEKTLPDAVEKAKGKFPIIVCTQDTRQETFIKATNSGASYLLHKNQYDPVVWKNKIEEILEEFKHKKNHQKEEKITDGFISGSPKMQELKNRLKLLPQFGSHAPVLLLGETGVGKEVAAKFLHQSKNNEKLPFISVNLSAISENLLESELFGHTKGAFTGATAAKKGLFEEAKGGTLFLDEIGEISLEMQVKMLRVLEEKQFRRVGDTSSINLEAQLVFATNIDIQKAIQTKTFREDFYQRISTISFEIPPLRERQVDIAPLINFFLGLEDICPPSFHLFGCTAEQCFSEAALSKLYQYHWPGNVRELRNSLQKMLFEVFATGKEKIDEDILPGRFHQNPIFYDGTENAGTNKRSNERNMPKPAHLSWPITKQTAYTELVTIEKALIDSGGRKNDAAQLLGLKNDQTIRYKVKVKYFNEYPELFDFFPTICKVYKL